MKPPSCTLPLAALVAGAVLSLPSAHAAPAASGRVVFIDLQPKSNQKLTENFHNARDSNSLEQLPTGEQTMAEVKFKIGPGMIQLGSTLVKGKPEKVEGIKVNQRAARLHFLHGTAYGRDPGPVEDGTVIGSYQVHYEDGTDAEVPIVYGKDVCDWWFDEGEKDTKRGHVAWVGDNANAKPLHCRIRLYLTTWKNPHPEKKITSLDYVATMKSPAAPFCVAVTAERK